MKDKEYTEGISLEHSTFLKKLDNFWYHYKWQTIVALFFVIVLGICVIQSCTKESGDFIITYAGRQYLQEDQRVEISNGLAKTLRAEGKSDTTTVDLKSYYILTEDQINAAQNENHSDGDRVHIDRSFIAAQEDSLSAQLQTGISSILLFDKELYKQYLGDDGTTERFVQLKTIFSSLPEGAVDDYAVELGSLSIYKNDPILRDALPADTVVCLHAKIMGQKNYDAEMQAFKLLIEAK